MFFMGVLREPKHCSASRRDSIIFPTSTGSTKNLHSIIVYNINQFQPLKMQIQFLKYNSQDIIASCAIIQHQRWTKNVN